MPAFAYTVRDKAGAIRKGTSEAENQDVLARRLREQGFVVSKIEQAKSMEDAKAKAGQKKKNVGGYGKVKASELAVFCRQFSTMIDAGVSLVRCLSVLSEQTESPKMKAIILDIQAEVEAGQTLSGALAKHPNTFSNLFTGLVKAGEVGGALEDSLQRLATFLEKDLDLKRKVKSAMTYPMIVMCLAGTIVIVLVTFVLPKFLQLFKDLGIKEDEFPGMTKVLMNISNFLTQGFPVNQIIFIGSVIGIYLGYKKLNSTKGGKRAFDTMRLKAPVFGNLNHKVALSRFSRTLGTLLVSGVPILQALETVAGTVDNSILSDAIMEARSRIREGDRIGDPLQKSKMFPPMVVQMISIGEESGSLDAMLHKVADFYESEVDSALDSLTATIEPLMIVGMGLVVGFIVIAMFMPLAKIIEQMTGGQNQ